MLEGVELFCCATARFSGIREIVNEICRATRVVPSLLAAALLQRMEGTQLHYCQNSYTPATSRNDVERQYRRHSTGGDVKYRCST